MTPLQKEGTIQFKIHHPHSDWITNTNSYRFDPIKQENILVRTFKNNTKVLHIILNGPLGHSVTLRKDISDINTKELYVVITWKDKIINIFLNGKKAIEYMI